MKDFKQKNIWITGASSGMGEALAVQLHALGAVVIASSENVPELQRVRDRITTDAERFYTVDFDLSDTSRINEIVETQVKKIGDIDVLIHMGGISQRSLLSETPLQNDRRIMEINYFGTIALTKAVLPYMLAAGKGYILATSSLAGKFGFPCRSAYCASKHALHGFFEALRLEHEKHNIRVSMIIPGRVRTNISKNAITSDGSLYGKMDPGQAKGISAEKAASQILKGMHREKKEILVGSSELLMLYLKRFVPGIFYNIARKIEPV
jgi:short-subunit dehydrogenase